MSNSAVLTRPAPSESAEQEWIELDPPIKFPSQEAMRSGHRTYTAKQGRVIDLAVANRRPLSAPALPIDA